MDASKIASLNPDNMIAGGLADDFDGVIKKVRFVPWNYVGTRDEYSLAVAVTITPDPVSGEEEFVQHYSAGELDNFVPSMDGDNPVPLDGYGTEEYGDPEQAEGIYAFKVGKKEGLSNSSNWAQFIIKALEANFPKDKLSAAASMFEGVIAHFNRIPQKKRAGLVKAEVPGQEKKRANDILVITEFKGFKAMSGQTPAAAAKKTTIAAKTTPAVTSTPATTAVTGGGSDLDTKLIAIIVAGVAAAGDEGLSKAKLPSLALKGLAGADKGKGVKRVVDADLLGTEGNGWIYDAESGMLYAG